MRIILLITMYLLMRKTDSETVGDGSGGISSSSDSWSGGGSGGGA